MNDYQLIYDFASLDLIKKSLFIFFPLIFFLGAKFVIATIDNEDEDYVLIKDDSEIQRIFAVIIK